MKTVTAYGDAHAAMKAVLMGDGIPESKADRTVSRIIDKMDGKTIRQFGRTCKKRRLARRRLRQLGIRREGPGPQARARARDRQGRVRASR